MKNFIIVSKCLRVTKIDQVDSLAEFHFKGVFAGRDVRRVFLFFNNETKISLGMEYLIFAELVAYEEKKLRGRVVKVKNLDSCADKS